MPRLLICRPAHAGSGLAAFQAGDLVDDRVSLASGAVLPTTDGTDAGEEHKMSKAADSSEPASALEHLIADLSASGPLIFVFGDGFTTAHLTGTTTPVFRGPPDKRWWHVPPGYTSASWTTDVAVYRITRGRFGRETY